MHGRRSFLIGLGATGLLTACKATQDQQLAALSPARSAVDSRTMQSRRFDTSDRGLMMQSALAALQDLGFTIEESDVRSGLIVGSKNAGTELRAQVSSRLLPQGGGIVMRATFQRVLHRPGAMLAMGETLDSPELYQGFFDRVAQSAFLTANDI